MLIRSVFTLVFIYFFSVCVLAEPKLSVHLERSAIYEGETFLYFLVLSDAKPLDDNVLPDTSVWTDFDVRFLGKQAEQRSSSSITMIINGQTIRDDKTAVTYIAQYSYELTPKRTGDLAIPLPKVVVKGTPLQPQTFSVAEGERNIFSDLSIAARVIKPEEQGDVFVTIEANRDRLYPLQPLEITLVIQIKALPGKYAQTNPLLLLRQPPQLRIPWVEETLRGFMPTQKRDQWLSNLLVRSPQRGFAINDLAGNKMSFDDDFFNMPFSMGDPFQKVPLQFSDTPRQIKRLDGQGNEGTYWEYRFTRTFVTQEIGDYPFGPVTLKGVIPVVADPEVSDELVGKQVYAVAPAVPVIVMDVPQQNRPADYIEAFGSFDWKAQLTPQQAKVGDPLTLTLSLSGQGSTANIRAPDLSINPEIADKFRVHMPPTEEIDERSCTFTYTIRPLQAGILAFPPISVSVFDVNTEQFVSLKSTSIPLEIAEAESAQSATVFGNVPESDLQIAEEGLFANKTEFTESFLPITFAHWAAAISLLAGSYVTIVLVTMLVRIRRTNPAQQRQRGAWSRAKLHLAGISSAIRQQKSANHVKICGELQGIFFGYIADKLEAVEQGMTTNDACQLLLDHNIPEPLVASIRSALESFDAIKYGGMDARSLKEWSNTVSTFLRQLEQSIKT